MGSDDDEQDDGVDPEGQAEGTDNSTDDSSESKDPDNEGKAKDKTKSTEISKEDASKHKSFYEAVTKEFRANNTSFTITDPDDVVSLMQKGLNYHKKMARIKPFMGIIELLKENELTDSTTLGYLIDLHNKKPEAIAKLVQDSGIDTYDLGEDQANAYVPSQAMIDPNVAELRAIQEEHANNPAFTAVVTDISSWDEAAKTQLGDNPQLISMLIEHKEAGYYDQIMHHVNREKAMGRDGNTLVLYEAIGKQLFSQGNQGQNNVAQASARPANPNAKKTEAIDARKRAAGVSKTPRGSNAKQLSFKPEDLLTMTAEDFKKIDPNSFATAILV